MTTDTLKFQTRIRSFQLYTGWVIGIGLFLLPLIPMDLTTYLTLTVAGISLGMLIFLIA